MSSVISSSDAVANAITHPVTMQVINQGPGIWGNVATGLITAGAAIAAVMLTHQFTLRREKLASEDKIQREQYFIATQLVFLLEQFAENCASHVLVSNLTEGCENSLTNHVRPEIDYSLVTGDWRSLPVRLMYKIHELPVQKIEADRTIESARFFPPINSGYQSELRYHYTKLGLKALILASRLRKLANFPKTPIVRNKFVASHSLWYTWRMERKRLSEQALRVNRSLASFTAKVAEQKKINTAEKDNKI